MLWLHLGDGWGHIQTSWSADLSMFTSRVCHWTKSPHSFHLVSFGLHWAELRGHDLGSFPVIFSWKMCVLVLRHPRTRCPTWCLSHPLWVPNPILVQSEEDSLFPMVLPSHPRFCLKWFPLTRTHPDSWDNLLWLSAKGSLTALLLWNRGGNRMRKFVIQGTGKDGMGAVLSSSQPLGLLLPSLVKGSAEPFLSPSLLFAWHTTPPVPRIPFPSMALPFSARLFLCAHLVVTRVT